MGILCISRYPEPGAAIRVCVRSPRRRVRDPAHRAVPLGEPRICLSHIRDQESPDKANPSGICEADCRISFGHWDHVGSG